MRFLFVSLLFFNVVLSAQEQKRTLFDLSSTTNPQYFDHAFWAGDNYISLARVKGKPNKESIYRLTSRSKELDVNWTTSFTNGEQQHFINFFKSGQKGYLIKNSYNDETKQSVLLKSTLDISSGQLSSFDTLCIDSVGDWQDSKSKAKVKQSFHNAVQSIQFSKYTTPLEYKYYMVFSPDSSNVLVYRYDFSQKQLWIDARIYNRDFELVEQGKVPVDSYHICYGIDVNDNGAIILYKVSESGRVVAVRSNLNDKNFKYVDLYTSNSTRDNLKLIQQDTSSLFMAKLNRKNESFVGITFSRFDFEKEKITETRYQAFDQAFKNQLYAEMKKSKIPNLDKNWYHYELTDFLIDKDSNRIIIVEERNIVSTEYEYRPESVEKPKVWNPIMGRVKAGMLMLWVFDKNNKLIYKHGFLKNQDIDATDGLNTISYKHQLLPEGRIRFVMAAEGKSNALNQIRIKEIDYNNNKILRDEYLSNPDKLVITRPFTSMKDDVLFYVGRKGILGKKTYLVKYKL